MAFFTLREQPSLSSTCPCGASFEANGPTDWIERHWTVWRTVHLTHRTEDYR